jgi:hypothetical protein
MGLTVPQVYEWAKVNHGSLRAIHQPLKDGRLILRRNRASSFLGDHEIEVSVLPSASAFKVKGVEIVGKTVEEVEPSVIVCVQMKGDIESEFSELSNTLLFSQSFIHSSLHIFKHFTEVGSGIKFVVRRVVVFVMFIHPARYFLLRRVIEMSLFAVPLNNIICRFQKFHLAPPSFLGD